MEEVEVLRMANRAVDVFITVYRTRYGTEPVLDHPIPFTAFLKSLIRKFGYDKTIGLIKQYLGMDGDRGSFVAKGHSTKVMEWEIEAVNAAYSLRNKQSQHAIPNDFLIQLDTLCPNCNNWFNVACLGSELHKVAHTKLCEACINHYNSAA